MRNNRLTKFMGLCPGVCALSDAGGLRKQSGHGQRLRAGERPGRNRRFSDGDGRRFRGDDGKGRNVSKSDAVQTAGSAVERAALEHLTEDAAAPEVFFTSDISAAGRFGRVRAFE